MIAVNQAIPCILHCENCCGEKIIKLLLVEALNELDGSEKEEKAFLSGFEEFVNTNILGSIARKTNWRIHTSKSKDHRQCIRDQTMPNNHVRKFIDKFESLLTFCLQSDSDDAALRKQNWLEAVVLYRNIIRTARRREDFSDDMIEEFAEMTDEFYRKWLSLHADKGVTNYFHMIGSGHLTHYLRKWRNLYQFLQQGWESLNHQIKIFYFSRTQRGGHTAGLPQECSKIKPIGLWLQRKLLWLSGIVP